MGGTWSACASAVSSPITEQWRKLRPVPKCCVLFRALLAAVKHFREPPRPRAAPHPKLLCLSPLYHARAVIATSCVEFAMPLMDVCLLSLARGLLFLPTERRI